MDAADNAVQEIEVEGSIGWTVKLNIPADPIPTPLFVSPNEDNPKRLPSQPNTEHGAELSEYNAGPC